METARSVTWSVGSGPAIEAKVPTGSVLCQGASPLKGGGSFHSGPARGIALSGRLRELLRQSARRRCRSLDAPRRGAAVPHALAPPAHPPVPPAASLSP